MGAKQHINHINHITPASTNTPADTLPADVCAALDHRPGIGYHCRRRNRPAGISCRCCPSIPRRLPTPRETADLATVAGAIEGLQR